MLCYYLQTLTTLKENARLCTGNDINDMHNFIMRVNRELALKTFALESLYVG